MFTFLKIQALFAVVSMEEMDPLVWRRQSPINLDTDPSHYDSLHTLHSDIGLSYSFGDVSRKNMVSPNNGMSLEFDLDAPNQYFSTNVFKAWPNMSE